MELETKQIVQRLITETNHQLTLEDFDPIQKIDNLTKKVIAPNVGDSNGLSGSVFFVGGIAVYPLTICRISLLIDLTKQCDDNIEDFLKFQAWIITTKDIEEREDVLIEYKTAKKEAKRAWKKLPWTPDELEWAIGTRFGNNSDDDEDSTKDEEYNPGSLIAMLVHDYGSTPDYWRYEAPIGIINSVMSDWYMRQEAQASAYRKSGGSSAPIASPKFKYSRLRRESVASLRKAWTDGKAKD